MAPSARPARGPARLGLAALWLLAAPAGAVRRAVASAADPYAQAEKRFKIACEKLMANLPDNFSKGFSSDDVASLCREILEDPRIWGRRPVDESHLRGWESAAFFISRVAADYESNLHTAAAGAAMGEIAEALASAIAVAREGPHAMTEVGVTDAIHKLMGPKNPREPLVGGPTARVFQHALGVWQEALSEFESASAACDVTPSGQQKTQHSVLESVKSSRFFEFYERAFQKASVASTWLSFAAGMYMLTSEYTSHSDILHSVRTDLPGLPVLCKDRDSSKNTKQHQIKALFVATEKVLNASDMLETAWKYAQAVSKLPPPPPSEGRSSEVEQFSRRKAKDIIGEAQGRPSGHMYKTRETGSDTKEGQPLKAEEAFDQASDRAIRLSKAIGMLDSESDKLEIDMLNKVEQLSTGKVDDIIGEVQEMLSGHMLETRERGNDSNVVQLRKEEEKLGKASDTHLKSSQKATRLKKAVDMLDSEIDGFEIDMLDKLLVCVLRVRDEAFNAHLTARLQQRVVSKSFTLEDE